MEEIPAGTIIWQFHKSTCQSFFKKLFVKYCQTLDFKELFDALQYSYVKNGNVYRVTDNTRFINHSCNPNICFLDDKTMVAARDIRKGEELIENYLASYDKNDFYFLDFYSETNKERLFLMMKDHLLQTEEGTAQFKLIS